MPVSGSETNSFSMRSTTIPDGARQTADYTNDSMSLGAPTKRDMQTLAQLQNQVNAGLSVSFDAEIASNTDRPRKLLQLNLHAGEHENIVV